MKVNENRLQMLKYKSRKPINPSRKSNSMPKTKTTIISISDDIDDTPNGEVSVSNARKMSRNALNAFIDKK